jgi:TolB-like protein
VIARNSSFAFKGKVGGLWSGARDLSVAYIILGSVWKSSGRVRITAQLVEAEAEGYIWVERFGQELQDIFKLWGKTTQNIRAAIAPVLGLLEVHHTLGKQP